MSYLPVARADTPLRYRRTSRASTLSRSRDGSSSMSNVRCPLSNVNGTLNDHVTFDISNLGDHMVWVLADGKVSNSVPIRISVCKE